MVSCSAIGCKNRGKRGSSLSFHTFPTKNAEVLKIWVERTARKNWKPSKNSLLCSDHFLPTDFLSKEDCCRIARTFNPNRRILKEGSVPTIFFGEKKLIHSIKRNLAEAMKLSEKQVHSDIELEARIPGKLKPTAVPSIFSYATEPRKPRPPYKRCSPKGMPPAHKGAQLDHTYISTPQPEAACVEDDLLSVPEADDSDDMQSPPVVCEDIESMKRQIDDLRRKCSKLEKENRKMEDLERKCSELEIENHTLVQNLNTFFNSDQLDYLKGKRHKNWSADTMKKAIEVESACGYTGYQTLIKQGYPLPSYKTLFIGTSGTFCIQSES